MVYQVKKLIITSKSGDWCKIPYPGHPKGCPNYGKSAKCPPNAPRLEEYLDTSRSLFLVHSEFDLTTHAARMKRLHPNWSERQCRCVLYWQPASRKQLKERVTTVMREYGLNCATACPEAMGLNVYATARLAGLKLEKIRNLSTCRHFALIGYRLHLIRRGHSCGDSTAPDISHERSRS